MVEDARAGVFRRALLGGDAHQPVERVVAHRDVRAERDQVVQLRGLPADRLVEQPEELAVGRGARAVRDDDEHALAAHIGLREALEDQFPNLILAQEAVGVTFADDHEDLQTANQRMANQRINGTGVGG